MHRHAKMPARRGRHAKKLNERAKKVKFRAAGRPLEAQVHTSLPPMVGGTPRGHLQVRVEGILWQFSVAPPAPKLCVRLKWWGERSPGVIFRVPVQLSGSDRHCHGDSTTLAYFPIQTGLEQLATYLTDMGQLILQVGLGRMTDGSSVIGQVIVPSLSGLTPATPVTGFFPIVGAEQAHLGTLHVQFHLEMAKSTTQQSPAASVAPTDDTAPPPEFVVGAGAWSRTRHSLDRNRAVGVSGQPLLRDGSESDDDGRAGKSSQPSSSHRTRAFTSRASPRERPVDSECAEGTASPPAREPILREMVEEGEGLAMGRHQLGVVSELIDRGRRLRDSMVQSVLESHPVPSQQHGLGMRLGQTGNETDVSQNEQSVPTVSFGAQRTNLFPLSGAVLHKDQGTELSLGDGRPPQSDRGVLDLLLGTRGRGGGGRGGGGGGGGGGEYGRGGELNLYAELSSDEEGGVVPSELSMNESDYPLYDRSLLEKLVYSREADPANKPLSTSSPRGDSVGSVDDSKPPTSTQAGALDDHAPSTIPLSDHAPSTVPLSDHAPSAAPTRTEGQSSAAPLPSVPRPLSPASSSTATPTAESELPATKSWSSISSLFGGHSKALEEAILRAVGMESLTKLGRVTTARVIIAELSLDLSSVEKILALQLGKRARKDEIGASKFTTMSLSSATYFVEYQFPASIRDGVSRVPSAEVMRVASKKMTAGTVNFGHRSVFPVMFTAHTVQQWWNGTLTFRVYCRLPRERLPLLVGKAVLQLCQWLSARSFAARCLLDLRASRLPEAVGGAPGEGPVVGKLQVTLQLILSKQQQASKCLSPKLVETGSRGPPPSEGSRGGESHAAPLPLKLREKGVLARPDIAQKDSKPRPPSLQLLLSIPEGIDITMHREVNVEGGGHFLEEGVPNCYLVCKLFCASPHPHSPVQWDSSAPQFSFSQVFPLLLTPALSEQVCNNFTVIELWHKSPGSGVEDELIGLVKLSLHQFFLAYGEEASAQLSLEAELPVVAVASHCPIVSPFSGGKHGYLAVLLALGTPSQVSTLQQQFASGKYILQPHHSRWQPRMSLNEEAPPAQNGTSLGYHSSGCLLNHTFVLRVEGVRDLSVLDSSVWGEADCFVQYHFPTLGCEEAGGEVTSLHSFRTSTTLCVPDPSFEHEARHSLALSTHCPVQRELMAACGADGVPFELWRRFYYPNIRDQLIAKACLPLAKLCALVTMQKRSSNDQSFSVPLRLVMEGSQSERCGGVLDISVRYEVKEDDGESNGGEGVKTHVNFTFGILRAAGLQDGAVLAAVGRPVPLGFAAEVGVNTYCNLILPPHLKQEPRTTKIVAQSFAPEFSHFFDISLTFEHTLDSRPPHSNKLDPLKYVTSLAEILSESSAIVEVWHQVSKTTSHCLPAQRNASGWKLGPSFQDVLLGRADIPLVQLLQKHTGIHGWFALESADSSIPQASTELSHFHKPAGGIELSFSFSNEDDLKLVWVQGLKSCWKLPQCGIDLGCVLTADGQHGSSEELQMDSINLEWKVSIEISQLCVPLESVAIPTARESSYKYCFVRYRLFKAAPVVSQPRTVDYCRDGVANLELNHRAHFCIPGSPQLKWYLNEEGLEVQVWASVFARLPSSSSSSSSSPSSLGPQAGDILMGFATVPLGELIGDGSQEDVHIKGWYPLFKPGADSFGGKRLHIEIRRAVLQSEGEVLKRQESITVHVQDASPEEEIDVSSQQITRETGSPLADLPASKSPPPTSSSPDLSEMFAAHVVLHQALHLSSATGSQQNQSLVCRPFVSFHPHPSLEKITTPVAVAIQTATWEHHCSTHIPNHYLEPPSPGLEFQVWLTMSQSDSQAGEADVDGDHYVGCAHIDLSPLAYGLRQISGWYNIVDFSGDTRGQLKVSIVPSEQISPPSRLLSQHPMSYRALSSMHSAATQVDEDQCVGDKTSSMLFRKLRKNIADLDEVHESLQQRLKDIQASSGSSLIPSQHSQPTALCHVPPGPPPVDDTEPSVAAPPTPSSQQSTVASHASPSPPPLLQPSLSFSTVSSDSSERASFLDGQPSADEPYLQGDFQDVAPVPQSGSGPNSPDRSGSPLNSSLVTLTDESVLIPSDCSQPISRSGTPPPSLTETAASVERGTVELGAASPDNVEMESEPTEISLHPPPAAREDNALPAVLSGDIPPKTDSETAPSYSLSSAPIQPRLSPAKQLHPSVSEPLPPPHQKPSHSQPSPRDSTTSDPAPPRDITTLHRHDPPPFRWPEIRLPNFFMPPHELEQSMRTLRASALVSRPPAPPTKSDRDAHTSHGGVAGESSTSQTLEGVSRYLESRRSQASVELHHANKPTTVSAPSDEETKRIAKIFSFKPTMAN